jgi:signal transduction histidine kinase
LNNAVKFTQNGRITIKLFEGHDENAGSYCVLIKDTGIGIPEEKQALIFEAFRQVSEGMNRLYQGTGLGLSVTKKFVELMNGKIIVDSKVNEGTAFSIFFPAYK